MSRGRGGGGPAAPAVIGGGAEGWQALGFGGAVGQAGVFLTLLLSFEFGARFAGGVERVVHRADVSGVVGELVGELDVGIEFEAPGFEGIQNRAAAVVFGDQPSLVIVRELD